MNKTTSIVLVIVSLASVLCVSAYAPRWIDDHNGFLKSFVEHDLLAVLGVILAITLASASQIHLKFNDIEEREKRVIFENARQELAVGCYALIGSFAAAVGLLVVKPLFVIHNFAVSAINGFSLWLLLLNILILLDITAGIFSIGPIIKPTDLPNAPPPSPAPPSTLERT